MLDDPILDDIGTIRRQFTAHETLDGRIDQAATVLNGRGLALEAQRDRDGDGLVQVHLDEVDVGHGAAHRVALQLICSIK